MVNSPENSPTERQAFAHRLRELRVTRGYRTARSLALDLGIDENRYTRYERAEVEPDIDLITRICRTLSLTPNVLFGFDSERPQTGFAEVAQGIISGYGSAGAAPTADISTAESEGAEASANAFTRFAWALADEIATVRARSAGAPSGGPLAQVATAMAIYKNLMDAPFETLEVLLREPALAHATVETQERIAELARQFARTASAAGPAPSNQA